MAFTANDPTFQGLLASLRRAQDTTLNEPTTPASAVGPWDTPVLTHGTNSVGQRSYTVPYELPPAVEGVFPTYASLEQARHGPDPADSRVQALADSYSPVSSALPTSLSVSIHSAAHQDPFATTSGGGQKPKDLRLLTFTQALPYLTRLVEDPSFLDVMRQLKTDQDALERRLFNEQKELIRSHKEAVEKAKFKASVSGQTSLTAFQQTDLAAGLATALANFHSQQVIPTWDYLLKTQIDKLESHGVPGLGTSKIERESELGSGRLRKILGVLEGALEDV